MSTAVGVTLSVVTVAAPIQAQSAARVLVAPLATGTGVDQKFGSKVAEEVAKGLEDFDAIEPMDKNEMKSALKRFGLEDQVLTQIQSESLREQVQLYGAVCGGTTALRGRRSGAWRGTCGVA